jgi:hypothetical protein
MCVHFACLRKSWGNMTTPAMAAGVVDHVWIADEIAAIAE